MVPPLVERELRVALLRRNAHKQWLTAAWMAGALTLFFMAVLGVTSNRSSGQHLFQWLFAFALGRIVLQGFALTADLLSEERRNGTLGLLVLTGVGPVGIFASKLAGAVLLTAYGLLGGLPFFAIPFLTGGVPAWHLLCGLVTLANILLYCVAIGLLSSVVHRDGGQAQLLGQIAAGALCAVTPLLYWFGTASGWIALGTDWLALSPAYPPYLVLTGLARGAVRLFWLGSAITLGYSVTAIVLASLFLQLNWREKPESLAPGRLAGLRRVFARGSARWQQVLRYRFLADQPFCWLATRDRRPVLVAYGIMLIGATVWFMGWLAKGPEWITPVSSVASSLVLHQALNWVGAYAAGRRLAEERVSGGFEILLTAPLQAAEVVEGQTQALLVQFRRLAFIVLLIDVALCLAGMVSLAPDGLRATTYVFAWLIMLACWFGVHLETAAKAMWISTWTGRPAYAAVKAGTSTVWWLLYIWLFSRHTLRALVSDSRFVLLISGLMVFPCLLSFARRRLLRQKLATELRLIACTPIPARGDKRFRSWDPNKISPPNPWGKAALRLANSVGRMDTLNG